MSRGSGSWRWCDQGTCSRHCRPRRTRQTRRRQRRQPPKHDARSGPPPQTAAPTWKAARERVRSRCPAVRRPGFFRRRVAAKKLRLRRMRCSSCCATRHVLSTCCARSAAEAVLDLPPFPAAAVATGATTAALTGATGLPASLLMRAAASGSAPVVEPEAEAAVAAAIDTLLSLPPLPLAPPAAIGLVWSRKRASMAYSTSKKSVSKNWLSNESFRKCSLRFMDRWRPPEAAERAEAEPAPAATVMVSKRFISALYIRIAAQVCATRCSAACSARSFFPPRLLSCMAPRAESGPEPSSFSPGCTGARAKSIR